jgi:hypothetical protein
MEMKKLHMGTMSYGSDSMDEVSHQLAMAFGAEKSKLGVVMTGRCLFRDQLINELVLPQRECSLRAEDGEICLLASEMSC